MRDVANSVHMKISREGMWAVSVEACNRSAQGRAYSITTRQEARILLDMVPLHAGLSASVSLWFTSSQAGLKEASHRKRTPTQALLPPGEGGRQAG